MSSSVANIYFASAHPWSGAIRSFSNISFQAFVIQIDDEAEAFTKLKVATGRAEDSTQQMSVAALVQDICSNIALIDATPAFLFGIDKRTLHAATNFFRHEIADLSIKGGLSFLKGLLDESSPMELIINGRLRLPKLKLTIHSRRSERNFLQILLSADWSGESATPHPTDLGLTGVLDSAADFIFAANLDGQINAMNRGMLEIYGRGFPEAQLDISGVLAPDSVNRFAQITTLITHTNEPWTGVLEFTHPVSSEVIPVNCRVSLNREWFDKKINGYCITGYRNLEKNPLTGAGVEPNKGQDESARLAVLGKIANHTMSEIYEPVEVIKAKAEKMKWLLHGESANHKGSWSSQQFKEHLDKVISMTERIANVVDGMKNLTSNHTQESMVNVKLTDLLGDVRELVESVAKKNGVFIEFENRLDALCVRMQRLRISQVLVNLVVNGCEGACKSSQKWVKLSVVTDSEWLYILVTDSGPDLSSELKMRLFEPYFTTKKQGQSNGIGLNLSRKIVREHGGDLYLDESSPSTRFVLELPLFERDKVQTQEEEWEEI